MQPSGAGGGSSAGKFAAGQAVEVQHSFQSGNVGVHVQRVGLEQLVQLVFKGGHQQVHAALDAVLGLGNVRALHRLPGKAGVGVQQLSAVGR